MCLLFAKSGIELLLLTLGGDNQFWRWQSWMLLFGLGAFALLQLWYLHKSLILADPTLVCPLSFCLYNVSCIFNSLVYYNQFSALSTGHLLLVLLGTTVLLGGVWSVSVKAGDRQGIDIGTFHEGEEAAEMSIIDEEAETRPPLVRPSHSLPTR
jgi:magnesium transporter